MLDSVVESMLNFEEFLLFDVSVVRPYCVESINVILCVTNFGDRWL